MREVDYRVTPIPPHLNSDKIKLEFKNNIDNKEYISKNTPYNDSEKTVKDSLKKIYHNKCVYCESSLHNAHAHIEHYRPKKSSNLSKCDSKKAYYWLAFSWDNLLPCCEICNGFKSNCFDTFNDKVDYDADETFDSLHNSLKRYNKEENPKLLHPEIDDFEQDINFYKKGQIVSKNEKVRYTLKVCKLNRKKLKEEREKILTKCQNNIKKQYVLSKLLDLDINKLSILFNKNVFNELRENLKIENSYSLVSYYIYNNFNLFLQNNSKLQDIDKKIIKQLWIKYENSLNY